MTDHTATDTLALLWDSAAALYAAFGLDAVSVPPGKRRRIFAEEADELKEASIEYGIDVHYGDGLTYSYGIKDEVADEAADVVFTVFGLLQAHGITPEEFRAACERVREKNAEKRPPEWAYSGGKIRRVE